MKLYIIRHGQTNSNVTGNLLGITDEDINSIGYNQALQIKKELEDIELDLCFSSNYKRTISTANLIIDKKIPVIIDERLNERNFGILEGGPYNDRYSSEFWNYYLNKSDYEVEPLHKLFDRTKDFLKFLKKNYDDKTILIVSHAATIRAIHYNIIGFDQNTKMLFFKVDNGQILKYDL